MPSSPLTPQNSTGLTLCSTGTTAQKRVSAKQTADGKPWQRWNDDSSTSEWDGTLTRFVYDGSQLVQEHVFSASEVESAWQYTYTDLTRDYLRRADGCEAGYRDDVRSRRQPDRGQGL